MVGFFRSTIGHLALGQIPFNAQNRFNAILAALLVEFDHAVHDPVIGQGQGVHFVAFCSSHQFRYRA